MFDIIQQFGQDAVLYGFFIAACSSIILFFIYAMVQDILDRRYWNDRSKKNFQCQEHIKQQIVQLQQQVEAIDDRVSRNFNFLHQCQKQQSILMLHLKSDKKEGIET